MYCFCRLSCCDNVQIHLKLFISSIFLSRLKSKSNLKYIPLGKCTIIFISTYHSSTVHRLYWYWLPLLDIFVLYCGFMLIKYFTQYLAHMLREQNKVNEVNITKIENCAHCKSFCVLCDLFYKKITANITFWRLTPLIFGEHFQVIFATWLDSRNTLLFWCLSKLSRPIVRRKYLHKVHIIPLNISKK